MQAELPVGNCVGVDAVALFLWTNVVNDRLLREQIFCDRCAVGLAQIFEAVLNRLPHRAFDPALLRSVAGAE